MIALDHWSLSDWFGPWVHSGHSREHVGRLPCIPSPKAPEELEQTLWRIEQERRTKERLEQERKQGRRTKPPSKLILLGVIAMLWLAFTFLTGEPW